MLSLALLLPPIYEYFTADGHAISSFGVRLPAVDNGKRLDLFCLFAYNFILNLSGSVALAAFDTLICIVFSCIPLISIIIARDIHELQRQLEDEKTSSAEIKRRFVKIILMHLDYKQ